MSTKDTWRWLKSLLHDREQLKIKCTQQQRVLDKAELIISMGQTNHSLEMQEALGICTQNFNQSNINTKPASETNTAAHTERGSKPRNIVSPRPQETSCDDSKAYNSFAHPARLSNTIIDSSNSVMFN